jgi:hypothetical protein
MVIMQYQTLEPPMPDPSVLQAMVTTTDIMTAATALTLALCVAQGRSGRTALPGSFLVAALFAWGAAWTWVPSLVSWRTSPLLDGTASALPTLAIIIGMAVALSGLALTPAAQSFFGRADRRTVLALGPWRTVYGIALLMIGLSGGLPAGFFWAAALGDILVGVIAIALLSRGDNVPDRAYAIWNIVGLIDLLDVLVLARAYIVPFFLANPHLPTLNMIPMVVVPAFIGLHVGALAHLSRRSAPRVAIAT